MKKLEQTLFNTTVSVGTQNDSIQKLEADVKELTKALKLATTVRRELQVQLNNVTKLTFDATAIGEWQALTNNHILELRNEMENTTDSIMDKMFEKDDSVGQKLREYDIKLLALHNEYNTLQTDMLIIDQASKEATSKAQDEVGKFHEE